jgi:hypothetical protein
MHQTTKMTQSRPASPSIPKGLPSQLRTTGNSDAELIAARNPSEQPYPTTVADAGQP